jgi:hypothetical protein
MSIKLKQPIINGSLRATNFFNGRLVTGADMTREQTARREAVWRAGKAVGDGIVFGLEVDIDKDAGVINPIVSVKKGLAVNRCGQALYVAEDTSVDLLQRFGTVDKPSTIFGDCQPLQVGTYAAGFGFYLLILSPVETNDGSAPTSGLNNALATCNSNVILETAQFNLLPVDAFLKNDNMPTGKLLRNYIAYRCFGTAKSYEFFKNPLVFPLGSYGLIDEMRGSSLADSDVPLALIHWTTKGIEFVETWAVRRRVTRRDDDENWTQLVKERRLSETEAMMMQFNEQIKRIETEEINPAGVEAVQHFRYLPPAGILPVTNGLQPGFNPAKFFGAKGSTVIPTLDGDLLPVLLEQARSHEPIDLSSTDSVQLYFVKENLGAVAAGGTSVRKSLVFARHSLPYMGKPVPKPQVFNFAPFFLPLTENNVFRWFVNFNQATFLPTYPPNSPPGAPEKDRVIRGYMLVNLPDNAVVKSMTVRGAQGVTVPKTFFVRLERRQIDVVKPPIEIVDINLSKEKAGKFTIEKNSKDVALVANKTFQYVVIAEWQGTIDRNVALPEINAIQITCEV